MPGRPPSSSGRIIAGKIVTVTSPAACRTWSTRRRREAQPMVRAAQAAANVHAGSTPRPALTFARITADGPDRSAYGWRAEHPRFRRLGARNRDAQREDGAVYAAAPAGGRSRCRAGRLRRRRRRLGAWSAAALATKNADAGDPVYLPAPATITALEVFEQGGRSASTNSSGSSSRRRHGRRRGDHGPRVPGKLLHRPGAPSPRRR